jgi:hypothetical protein
MKMLKRISILMTTIMIGLTLCAGEVMAYSDVYFSGIGGITFVGAGGPTVGSTFSFDLGGVISSATTPGGYYTNWAADAVVGKYINFFNTGTTNQATFTLAADLGNDIWSLGNQEVTVSVTSKAFGVGLGNIQYYSGTLIARTINFDTGTINWDIGTTPAYINTSVNSPTLGILANNDNDTHYASITNMIFDTTNPNLITWLAGGSAWADASYTATVTVSPEPGEWALMLVGLGMIGFAIYRKNPRFELTEALDFRVS